MSCWTPDTRWSRSTPSTRSGAATPSSQLCLAKVVRASSETTAERVATWSGIRDAALACRLALESDVTGARVYVIANDDCVMTTPNAGLVEQVFPGTPHKTPSRATPRS